VFGRPNSNGAVRPRKRPPSHWVTVTASTEGGEEDEACIKLRVWVGNATKRAPPTTLKKASRAKARRIMVPGAERSMEMGWEEREGVMCALEAQDIVAECVGRLKWRVLVAGAGGVQKLGVDIDN